MTEMIKQIFNKVVIGIFIVFVVPFLFNAGSLFATKLFGLTPYLSSIAMADNFAFNPYECDPGASFFTQTTKSLVTYSGYQQARASGSNLAGSNDATSDIPANQPSGLITLVGNEDSWAYYSSFNTTGGLYYRAKREIDLSNDVQIYYACMEGEVWANVDTDQDGEPNGTDPEWWNSNESGSSDPCDSQQNILVSELGKEWNLSQTVNGLPIKFTTTIDGLNCSYDRISTAIDGNNVTATYDPAPGDGTGTLQDMPSDFAQFVLRRCDGELLSGQSLGIAWDALPNAICANSSFGVCLFENPDTNPSSIGNLVVTYTATDALNCNDPLPSINWNDYASLCSEKSFISVNVVGDQWDGLPQHVGDSECNFELDNSFCADGSCHATYSPTGAINTNGLPDFAQYASEDTGPPQVNPNTTSGYDYATDSTTPLPYNSLDSAVTGRHDACVQSVNCSGHNCNPNWNNGNIRLLSDVHEEIKIHHESTDEVIRGESNSQVQICTEKYSNGDCANVQTIGNCHTYHRYSTGNISYSPHALGDGTGTLTIAIASHGAGGAKFDNGEVQGSHQLLSTQPIGTQICRAVAGGNNFTNATYTYEMHGFAVNGICDGENENNDPNNPANTLDCNLPENTGASECLESKLLAEIRDELDLEANEHLEQISDDIHTLVDGELETQPAQDRVDAISQVIQDAIDFDDDLINSVPEDHHIFSQTYFDNLKNELDDWIPTTISCNDVSFSLPSSRSFIINCSSMTTLRTILEWLFYVGTIISISRTFFESSKVPV